MFINPYPPCLDRLDLWWLYYIIRVFKKENTISGRGGSNGLNLYNCKLVSNFYFRTRTLPAIKKPCPKPVPFESGRVKNSPNWVLLSSLSLSGIGPTSFRAICVVYYFYNNNYSPKLKVLRNKLNFKFKKFTHPSRTKRILYPRKRNSKSKSSPIVPTPLYIWPVRTQLNLVLILF